MTRSHLFAAFAFAVALAGGRSPAAHAAPVSYWFSGTVELLGGLAPAALAGNAVSGSFTYDPAAAVVVNGANLLGYAAGSASLSVQTTLGTGATAPDIGQFGMTWDALVASTLSGAFDPADQFSLGGPGVFDAPLSMFDALNVQFVDGTGGAADDPFGASLSPPPATLSLSEMDAAELHLAGTGVVEGSLRVTAFAAARITCLGTSPTACAAAVPAPGTTALLVLGLAGIVAMRRRHA